MSWKPHFQVAVVTDKVWKLLLRICFLKVWLIWLSSQQDFESYVFFILCWKPFTFSFHPWIHLKRITKFRIRFLVSKIVSVLYSIEDEILFSNWLEDVGNSKHSMMKGILHSFIKIWYYLLLILIVNVTENTFFYNFEGKSKKSISRIIVRQQRHAHSRVEILIRWDELIECRHLRDWLGALHRPPASTSEWRLRLAALLSSWSFIHSCIPSVGWAQALPSFSSFWTLAVVNSCGKLENLLFHILTQYVRFYCSKT